MPSERYWLWLGETQSGPYSLAQIMTMAEPIPPDEEFPEGCPPEVTAETLYFSPERDRWEPLRMFAEAQWGDQSVKRLASMREAEVEWVSYLASGTGEDCPQCLAMDQKSFPLSAAKPIPLDGCTCSPWPRTVWIAVKAPS